MSIEEDKMIKVITIRRQQQGGEQSVTIAATEALCLGLTPDTVVSWVHAEYQHFEAIGGTRTLSRQERECKAGEIPYLTFPICGRHKVRKHGAVCLLAPV